MVFDFKFPTDKGVGVVHGDQATGRACYVAELREAQRREKEKVANSSVRIQNTDN